MMYGLKHYEYWYGINSVVTGFTTEKFKNKINIIEFLLQKDIFTLNKVKLIKL